MEYTRHTPSGDRTMFRKLILPMLATAMLAGCATDYNYRGGNGDYYYGQPRVEYRYQGFGGFNDGYYGGVGFGYGSASFGYGPRAYYDPFGRLVYGYPGRYGYGNGWYQQRPRTHREHDRRDHDGRDQDGHDGHTRDDGNRHDRRPPWRNLGGLQGGDVDNLSRDDDGGQPRLQRKRAMAYPVTAPQGQQRVQQFSAPNAPPVFRQHSEMSPRIGGARRGVRGGKSRAPIDADE